VWKLPIDEIAQDREDVGHGFTSARFTLLYDAERNALLGHVASLMQQLGDPTDTHATRPPQPDCGGD